MEAEILQIVTEHEKVLLPNLVIVLTTAALVALLFQRLKIALFPAYLIAGILAGPHVLGLISSPAVLEEIAHLAVIFLLFGIGLELHFSALFKSGLQRMILTGIGSTLLSTVLGFGIGWWLGLPAPVGLAIAMAFSLSSTAVVLRHYAQERKLIHLSGRLGLAILIIQDMAVLGMLALLPLLAMWQNQGSFLMDSSTASAGYAIKKSLIMLGGISGLFIAGRFCFPYLMRQAAQARSLELMILTGVAAAFGTAALAQMLGFSLETGAFLAGLLLANTPFRSQLGSQIVPLRDIFMAVFFTTLGMELNVVIVLGSWWIALTVLILLILLKTISISITSWSLGFPPSIAIAVGLSLAQAGEFSLILLGEAHESHLLDPELFSITVSAVVLSLIVTPALFWLNEPVSRLFAKWFSAFMRKTAISEDENVDPSTTPRIVLAGFGPFGRRLAEEFDRLGLLYTIVELNPKTVSEETRPGRKIVFGDISNPHILESAGIHQAAALILTFPAPEIAARTAKFVRHEAPNVFIAARAETVMNQKKLDQSGVDCVVVDELTSANHMLDALIPFLSELLPKEKIESD